MGSDGENKNNGGDGGNMVVQSSFATFDVSTFPLFVAAVDKGGLQDAPHPGRDPTVPHVRAAASAAGQPGEGAKDPQLLGHVLHRGAEVSCIFV